MELGPITPLLRLALLLVVALLRNHHAEKSKGISVMMKRKFDLLVDHIGVLRVPSSLRSISFLISMATA